MLIPATLMGLIITFNDYDMLPFKVKTFAFFDHEILGDRHFFTMIETNITNTLVGVFFIIGALFVSFSKEKNEDEFISKLRLSSLLWAVLVNYILLLVSFLFIYGSSFLTVMVYNMFTVLIIFIVRFNYILYKNSNLEADEK